MATSGPTLYLVAGCNGAGKTSFFKEFQPREIKDFLFLNADDFAQRLAPSNPTAVAVKAARLLLRELDECLCQRKTFALESTLSGKTYVRMLRRALELGYEVELHYLWLSSAAKAVERVQHRVRTGGHAVPEEDVIRRYGRSLTHLVDDYLPLASRWTIWDSRELPAKKLASSEVEDINFVRGMISATGGKLV